ncbi:MAG TPA: hypothetical protein VKB09_04355 [Thermomicrobiales bacterium]|nr:hypothetical protein [Thermomicrobiales bacterium]
MGNVQHSKTLPIIALVLVAVLAAFAGTPFIRTSAADRNDVPRTGEIAWLTQDAENFTEAARFDIAEAKGQLVSGIPGPLLAALAGMPQEAMGWGGIARMFLSPGATTPVLVGPGTIFYAIESGQVVVQSDGALQVLYAGEVRAQELVLHGDEISLGPGDRVLVRAGVSHMLRGSGLDEASVLAATVIPESVTTQPGFGNQGVSPAVPFGVSMFLAAGEGEEKAWPRGITVTRLVAEPITFGPR